jgi:hypothetical protein
MSRQNLVYLGVPPVCVLWYLQRQGKPQGKGLAEPATVTLPYQPWIDPTATAASLVVIPP